MFSIKHSIINLSYKLYDFLIPFMIKKLILYEIYSYNNLYKINKKNEILIFITTIRINFFFFK